jgi:four helix bundle protein
MTAEILKNRSKKNALAIIKLVPLLPHNPVGWVIGKQLIRSSTSVAANYRAVCRAKSKADFISKLGTVEEEADETCFWIEIIKEAELAENGAFDNVHKEAKELLAIFTASRKTAKQS